ncbi:hypothetical protein [Sandarakinorhabdus oryzae]|uniref:hypothetical protein n=1 Tax=Sandarakinorhabdus oryzae TaxID=2675220 RepID=UPI0012E19B19|nr:hypothetical protein [Sandarakinorhabdus oryzae]
MKSPSPPTGADDKAVQPATPSFHVELTPVPADARPFHALHGTVPAPAVPHIPSHIEEVVEHPAPKLP